jgi:two-component system, NarL family, invasion response regulator UvrY
VAQGGRYIEAEIAQALAPKGSAGGRLMEQLPERDLEIVRLLGDGQGLSNITDALGVSYKTVANTSSQIKAKLGVARPGLYRDWITERYELERREAGLFGRLNWS